MKKLQCASCGAKLKIEEGKEYAICEHCGSKYKLNEDLNINIKIDDSVKEILNKGTNATKKISKFILIPTVVFIALFVFFTGFLLFNSKNRFDEKEENNKEFEEENQNYYEEFEEQIKQHLKENDKDNFNFQFVHAKGTHNGFLLKDVLDNIIESNKTNDRKIILVFEGNTTTEENQILNYKHSLNDYADYEVIVNYDSDGYINEIKVDKINN